MSGFKKLDRGDQKLLQLHIGGKEVKEGWKILNALPAEGVDFLGDVRDLSQFKDGSCEKIYASHVLEHIGQQDFIPTLKEIHRILCKAGTFYFSVPDLEMLCKLFIKPDLNTAQRIEVMRMIFGGQTDEYDFHQIGLSAELMVDFLRIAGFTSLKRVESFGLFNDTSNYQAYGFPISLNLIVYK
jgi:predicted SAM-dependent methyltransferase